MVMLIGRARGEGADYHAAVRFFSSRYVPLCSRHPTSNGATRTLPFPIANYRIPW